MNSKKEKVQNIQIESTKNSDSYISVENYVVPDFKGKRAKIRSPHLVNKTDAVYLMKFVEIDEVEED
jgi:hypothetical protein